MHSQCLLVNLGDGLSERQLLLLASLANGLDLTVLYAVWYKKLGRALEKKLVAAAKAKAPQNLLPKVNQVRFKAVLRQAFKDEEDEDELELLTLCKVVLEAEQAIPDADAFIAVHRVICDANAWAHDDDIMNTTRLQELLTDGPDGAYALATSIGQPAAAPMIKKMAGDLLKVPWAA
ncbi:hypothetical protein GPECTOR_20g589 [Gonium pectorale]|uniref:Uncharacterized protein n=1 Tax=Gonium pectorale TaxID=33097 RepID=A0A150GIU2_GONPE|nr:hypothetical protein GPECTOR_20g589 [Gonium pectorale]|eukprot:KXZ49732.1 hypothetical protein GPECTOR_20g589 [Gonium pectorale]